MSDTKHTPQNVRLHHANHHGVCMDCKGKHPCDASILLDKVAELERQIERQKRLQPRDRDDRPITQAVANRLMCAAEGKP